MLRRYTALLFACLLFCGSALAQADLSLSLTRSVANPAQFTLYSATVTITNDGPQAARPTVRIPTQSGQVFEGGNAFAASQGSFVLFGPQADIWTVGLLPSGASATLQLNYFVNAAQAPTNYAEVETSNRNDPDSTPGNGNGQVNEDDEASSAGSGGGGGGGGQPDLTLSNLRLPSQTVAAGGVLNYLFDASNIGTADVPGNFTIKAFLSTDNVLSANDIQDGTITTGNFAAGSTVTDIQGASNVSGLAPGDYFLILKIDADNAVAESAEGNNVRRRLFTVTGGGGGGGGGNGDIDLSLSLSQNPSNPNQFSLYSVTATVSNAGPAGATGVKVSIPRPAGVVYEGGNAFSATQGSLELFGPQAGIWDVGALASGASASITVNYFLNAATAPDSYAEVEAANQNDSDSTPGNGNGAVNEDDEASTGGGGGGGGPTCDVQASVANVVCDDNGTASDPSDDTYTATITVTNPTGTFAGFSVSGAPVTYGFREYGVAFTIPLGNITQRPTTTLTFTDLNDPSCQGTTTISAPQTCSSGGGGGGGNACAFEYTFRPVSPLTPGGVSGPRRFTAQQLSGGDVLLTQLRYLPQPGVAETYTQQDEYRARRRTTVDNSGAVVSAAANNTRTTRLKQRVSNPDALIVETLVNGNVQSTSTLPFTLFDLSDPRINLVGGRVLAIGGPGAAEYLFVGQVFDSRNSANGFELVTVLFDDNDNVLGEYVIDSFDPGVSATAFDVVRRTNGQLALVAESGSARFPALYFLDAQGRRLGARIDLPGVRLTYVDNTLQPLPNAAVGLAFRSNDFSYAATVAANRTIETLQFTGPGRSNLNNAVFSANGGAAISGSLTAGSVTELVTVFTNAGAQRYSVDFSAEPRFSEPTVIGVTNGGAAYVLAKDTEAGNPTLDRTLLRIDANGNLNCGGGGGSGGNGVDLELAATSAQQQPPIYDINSITFTLTNAGTTTATGVEVTAPLPSGVVRTGGNEFTASQGTFGTFGAQNGVWSVGSLAPGATATLVVNYFSLSATGYDQFGEVTALNETDTDSTPGNGSGTSASEDDEVFLDLSSGARAALRIDFYPNPAPQGEQLVLRYESSGDVDVPVLVSDFNGRIVSRTTASFAAGPNVVPVSIGELPAGVYVVSMPSTGLEPTRLVVR